MEVRNRVEQASMAAVQKTLAHIQSHLDEPLAPCDLANVACFSQHHFHRLFRAVVGESFMDHIRRLRLEKAAFRLKNSRALVATIALDAIYGSQEAFTRTFQAYYGIAPTTYRYSHSSRYHLPAPSGIHYSPSGYTPLTKAVQPELLDDNGLCNAHRNMPNSPVDQLEQLLSIVTGFHFSVSPLPFENIHSSNKSMNTQYSEIDKEIEAMHAEVEAAKQRLLEVQKRRPKEPVQDYVLKDSEEKDVRLSDLFEGKEDLILIHNMGSDCIYCTVWADGLTGLIPHISDRTAFVLCSPDTWEVQKKFAAKRNWNFRMVSAAESSFTKDMGFISEDGPHSGPMPGISIFRKAPDGSINRVGRTFLGPAYDCAVWPLFEMLEGGSNGWSPKYNYEDKP